jgi:transposase
MEHKSGRSREQIILFPEAIEDYITEENPVRFIDTFVDRLDTIKLGFEHAVLKETGRPPYDPKDLLKLHLYGLLNRIRSSRLLERETKRNLEVIWLLKHISADHKTISDFRKNNGKAIKKTFKEFYLICKELDLYGGELAAVDSSKFKASNARDKVVDKETIEKRIEKIEQSIDMYLEELDNNDKTEPEDKAITKEELDQKIEILKKKKIQLEEAEKELLKTTEKYISLTDKDCRLIKDKDGIEPSFRMQTAVDEKHSMIIDFEMTEKSADNNHLLEMSKKAKKALGVEELTVVADAGYFDSIEIKECEDNKITTYVPIPKQKVSSKTKVPAEEYYFDKFTYDEHEDLYYCPEGEKLIYKNTYRDNDRKKTIHIYSTDKCNKCINKNKCTLSPRGREIHRWEHAAVIDRLRERLQQTPELIKRRKAIIEHIFGTLKKIWNYYGLQLRGLKNVSTEAALMCLAYNIRRAISIVGTKKLIMSLQKT